MSEAFVTHLCCSQLFRAAQKGDVSLAEDVMRQMTADGFQPGPRSYHALIFAHVKAESASGALTAIRRAHASGQPTNLLNPSKIASL